MFSPVLGTSCYRIIHSIVIPLMVTLAGGGDLLLAFLYQIFIQLHASFVIGMSAVISYSMSALAFSEWLLRLAYSREFLCSPRCHNSDWYLFGLLHTVTSSSMSFCVSSYIHDFC